jgi:hypothetical protein
MFEEARTDERKRIKRNLAAYVGANELEEMDNATKEETIKKIIDLKYSWRKNIAEEEREFVSEFISKFFFTTSGRHTQLVDLKLALKALPIRVDAFNHRRVELFNFESA